MRFPHCADCRYTVVWHAMAVNSGLTILKGALGLMTGSAALVADAFHSCADVIADVMTIVGLRISNSPADEEHTYGHGKIQFISSALVGFILVVGSSWLLIGSLLALIKGTYETPSRLAMFGAVISIIANEIMARDQICVSKELNNQAILATAWDNRSDAISSAGVLVGLLFATFGYPIADALVSVGISLIVFYIGFKLIVECVNLLMDSGADSDELKKIYKIVKHFPGVLGITYLRGREMGEELHVDINVQVDENLKVYEADLLVDVLKDKIAQGFEERKVNIQLYLTPVTETA